MADAIARAAVERIWATLEGEDPAQAFRLGRGFCVVAFGKLGGRELNYSSDIDLIGVYQPLPGGDRDKEQGVYDRVMERLRDDLARHTAEGSAYRVDLRLRPYGSSGMLVYPIDSLAEYYESTAGLWEIQALLKARPVAGSLEVGERFLERVRPILLRPWPGARIADSIERMRGHAVQAVARATPEEHDIKSGLGGIRDLEFMVQGLQLAHASSHPALLAGNAGNTLEALAALEAEGILPAAEASVVRQDYTLLRRIEHALQVLNDQQRHRLPTQPGELRALARRVLGADSDESDLAARLDECQARVRSCYEDTLSRLRSLHAGG